MVKSCVRPGIIARATAYLLLNITSLKQNTRDHHYQFAYFSWTELHSFASRLCAFTHWGWDKMADIFADDILKWIFFDVNIWIWVTISLKFVPNGLNDKKPVLVKIMAWRRTVDKPLSEPNAGLVYRCDLGELRNCEILCVEVTTNKASLNKGWWTLWNIQDLFANQESSILGGPGAKFCERTSTWLRP